MIHNFTLQMIRKMIRNWKETPANLALFLGMFVSIAIANWIHDAFFSESDDRLGTIFVFIALMATAYAHFLIYRREALGSLHDELLGLGILAAGFGTGIWLSFAYLDGDSILSDIPIYAGPLVAWGVGFLIRKWFRKA